MLNIRTFILSVALVAIFVLTVGLVTARTESVSVASSNPASVPEIRERPADPSDAYGASSYRSQFGECFDVPIRELAACLNASQALVQADQSPVDECFDVSNISERAGCRDASQVSIQADQSPVDECFDVSISELAGCRNLASVAYAATGVTDPVVLKELAQVRQATAKYHDVNVALADGFIPTPHCIAEPGFGVMGIHYINPARLIDPAINLLEPEILLYVETKNGLKLLGVEYFQGIAAPDTPIPNPAPPAAVILGRPLDGPMDAHEPGQPPHYDLHVWVWQVNPSDIFAPFNPNVSCE